jgi:hypothetical protein
MCDVGTSHGPASSATTTIHYRYNCKIYNTNHKSIGQNANFHAARQFRSTLRISTTTVRELEQMNIVDSSYLHACVHKVAGIQITTNLKETLGQT